MGKPLHSLFQEVVTFRIRRRVTIAYIRKEHDIKKKISIRLYVKCLDPDLFQNSTSLVVLKRMDHWILTSA